jgi:hypothetical protein
VTFRDVSRGAVLATVRATSITSVTLDLGAALRSIVAEYSGDDNYFAGASPRYSYSPTAVAVSPVDSRLTVTSAKGQGYDIEVQLLGLGGQHLQMDTNSAPDISISSSRGVPDFPAYRGDGRYTSSLSISRSAAELLTISAQVNDTLIGSISIAPSIPKRRAVQK